VAGLPSSEEVSAKDKHVIVIGGGDTGSDCVGTAMRQGARHIVNFELMPMPPEPRPEHQPWPFWPMRLRTSSSHKEGGQRYWSIVTKEFIAMDGKIRRLKTVNVDVHFSPGGRTEIREIPGTEYEWRAELVLLAMGFAGADPDGVARRMGVLLTSQGHAQTDDRFRTSEPHIYAAGDFRRGQSLVVWAISEGRECARCIDEDLMGRTILPAKGGADLPRI
jgi:glutamate synthase (NADPH/NADH) small chain